jgi:hypothetical protein
LEEVMGDFKGLGASVPDQALAEATPASAVDGPAGFDPSRIGDLPERLFTHSLELVGDDEDEEPSVLFNEVQTAAMLLAEIRNAAR